MKTSITNIATTAICFFSVFNCLKSLTYAALINCFRGEKFYDRNVFDWHNCTVCLDPQGLSQFTLECNQCCGTMTTRQSTKGYAAATPTTPSLTLTSLRSTSKLKSQSGFQSSLPPTSTTEYPSGSRPSPGRIDIGTSPNSNSEDAVTLQHNAQGKEPATGGRLLTKVSSIAILVVACCVIAAPVLGIALVLRKRIKKRHSVPNESDMVRTTDESPGIQCSEDQAESPFIPASR